MKCTVFGLLIISLGSLFSSGAFAQECPSYGEISKIDKTRTSIELSIVSASESIELNIFDTDIGGYIYSESKLDPGFNIQENISTRRIGGNRIRITGFQQPFIDNRYQIVVLAKNCKPVKLDIRE